MKRALFFFVLTGGLLFSCQHDPDTAPKITITPPADSLFFSGETLFIIGDLSDVDGLKQSYICVRDTADTMLAYNPNVSDLTSFHIDTFWVVTGNGPAELSLRAENEHNMVTILDLPFLRF